MYLQKYKITENMSDSFFEAATLCLFDSAANPECFLSEPLEVDTWNGFHFRGVSGQGSGGGFPALLMGLASSVVWCRSQQAALLDTS